MVGRRPMQKTAPSINWNSGANRFELNGEITCSVSGEWSGGIKCWTEVGKPNGNQYSLMKKDGRFFFVLEAVN